MTVSIGKIDELIKNRVDCAGPRTTFPRHGRETAYAEVTTICSLDSHVPYVQWLASMVADVPAVLHVVRTLLVMNEAKRVSAQALRTFQFQRSDAAYNAADQAERALAKAISDHNDALAQVSP